MFKPKFYMLVGISGSGKSFAAEQLRKIHLGKTIICSSDAIRAELWGDESNQKNPQKVFQILHKRVKDNLKKGYHVIYDATNLSRKRRVAFLEEIRKIPCYKSCIIMGTLFVECVERDEKRKRSVGIDVIKRQRENFQCPYFYEGWDSIDIVNSDVPRIYELNKMVQDLREIPHDNPHHSLSIGNHMLAAQEYCLKQKLQLENQLNKYIQQDSKIDKFKVEQFEKEIEEWYVASVVAKYHDIGKGLTKSFFNTKGEPTDIAHYYNHQNVSAYEIISRLRFAELFKEDVVENFNKNFNFDQYWLMIAVLVNLHMEPFFKKEQTKSWSKFNKLIGKRFSQIILKTHEADRNSH